MILQDFISLTLIISNITAVVFCVFDIFFQQRKEKFHCCTVYKTLARGFVSVGYFAPDERLIAKHQINCFSNDL